jgi:HPt (histidine-containing phosphotransfer) domain-containing protein
MSIDAQNEMMAELRKSYLKSFPQKLSALSDAFASRDFESLSRLGHQLKGSGQSYGFPEISRLGQEIENAALITECTQLDSILAELENTLKRITESRTSK